MVYLRSACELFEVYFELFEVYFELFEVYLLRELERLADRLFSLDRKGVIGCGLFNAS